MREFLTCCRRYCFRWSQHDPTLSNSATSWSWSWLRILWIFVFSQTKSSEGQLSDSIKVLRNYHKQSGSCSCKKDSLSSVIFYDAVYSDCVFVLWPTDQRNSKWFARYTWTFVLRNYSITWMPESNCLRPNSSWGFARSRWAAKVWEDLKCGVQCDMIIWKNGVARSQKRFP